MAKTIDQSNSYFASERESPLIPFHAWVQIAVLGFLFVVFHNTVLGLLYQTGRRDPDWSHMFFIPFISIYLIYRQKPVLKQIQPERAWQGLAILALGAIGYIGGQYLTSTMVMGYTMVLSLAGLVWFFVGNRMMKWLWLPVFYLLFGISSQYFYGHVSGVLQNVASTIGAIGVTIAGLPLGVEADNVGVLIEIYHNGRLINPPLNVAEACSGLRSLMAMTAIAVALAFIDWRPWYSRLTIAVAAIPVAVTVNAIRIILTGLVYPFNPELTHGDAHDLTGLLLLVPGMLFLLFITKLIDHYWGFSSYRDIKLTEG